MNDTDLDNFAGRAPRLLSSIESGIEEFLTHQENAGLTDATRDVDEFQEDPRLLDGLLQRTLPRLGEAYLETLDHSGEQVNHEPQSAFGKLVYTMAKVRGERAIAMRLPAQPNCFIPVLNALDRLSSSLPADEPQTGEGTWEERYSVLLWLSHLISIPFDLIALSDEGVPDESDKPRESPLPEIVQKVLDTTTVALQSASREGSPAATVMSRLCLRPDMAPLDLAGRLIRKASKSLESISTTGDGKSMLLAQGLLRFLNKTVKGADSASSREWILPLRNLYSVLAASELAASTVLGRLIIIGQRDIGVQLLKSAYAGFIAISELSYMESLVTELFTSLASPENVIRQTAAKAVALIIRESRDESKIAKVLDQLSLRLEQDIDSDPVLAESMYMASIRIQENWPPFQQAFMWADPNLWHGALLAFTYISQKVKPGYSEAHLRFFKLIRLGLYFQDSADITKTGKCELVRESANLATWMVARSLKELPESEMYRFATALIDSLSFDNSSKIRSCSVGALQELLGKHPRKVQDSVLLVQAAAHTSKSRPGTMGDACIGIADISPFYRTVMLKGLMGWRGSLSHDRDARVRAAETMKVISKFEPFRHPIIPFPAKLEIDESTASTVDAAWLAECIQKRFATYHQEDFGGEARHGYFLLLSATLLSNACNEDATKSSFRNWLHALINDFADQLIFDEAIVYTAPTTHAMQNCQDALEFIFSVSAAATSARLREVEFGEPFMSEVFMRCFTLCLQRREAAVYEKIPAALSGLAKLPWQKGSLVESALQWLSDITREASTNVLMGKRVHAPGKYLAIAVAVAHMSKCQIPPAKDLDEFLRPVIQLSATDKHHLDNRIVSFKAMKSFLRAQYSLDDEWYRSDLCWKVRPSDEIFIVSATYAHSANDMGLSNTQQGQSQPVELTASAQFVYEQFFGAISGGLEDFTLNERGDIGADVRMEALELLQTLWQTAPKDFQLSTTKSNELSVVYSRLHVSLSCALFRLCFDRIDRVREAVLNLLTATTGTNSTYKPCFYPYLDQDCLSGLEFGSSPQPEMRFANVLQHLRLKALSFAHRAIIDGFCEIVSFGSLTQTSQARQGLELLIRETKSTEREELIRTLLTTICTGLDPVFDWRVGKTNSSRLDFERLVAAKLETLAYLAQSGMMALVEHTEWFKPALSTMIVSAIRQLIKLRGRFALRIRLACYDVMRLLGGLPSTTEEALQFFTSEQLRLSKIARLSIIKQKVRPAIQEETRETDWPNRASNPYRRYY
jgi:hypothetical protein